MGLLLLQYCMCMLAVPTVVPVPVSVSVVSSVRGRTVSSSSSYYFILCFVSRRKRKVVHTVVIVHIIPPSEWVRLESKKKASRRPESNQWPMDISCFTSTVHRSTNWATTSLLAHCSIFEYNKIRLNWQYWHLYLVQYVEPYYRCLTKL